TEASPSHGKASEHGSEALHNFMRALALLLPLPLLVPVLPQALLSLVRRDLLPLALLPTTHCWSTLLVQRKPPRLLAGFHPIGGAYRMNRTAVKPLAAGLETEPDRDSGRGSGRISAAVVHDSDHRRVYRAERILQRLGRFARSHEEDGGAGAGLRDVSSDQRSPAGSAGIVERIDPDELDPAHGRHRVRRHDRPDDPRFLHVPPGWLTRSPASRTCPT